MRRTCLLLLIAIVSTVSTLSAQTQAPRLRGNVVDASGLAMAGATVKVYEDKEEKKVVAEGVTDTVGNFDIEVPAGDYRIEVSAPDFAAFQQTIKSAANMPPLAVTLSLKPVDTIVEVSSNQNEIGVDPDSSLTTDVITGDALLDLPDNEEDLLSYLEQLASARGIVDGDLNIRVDGFDNSRLPNRNEIQEIRIVNNSFSAESNGSGPRIEIITRPGSSFWGGNLGFTFADESLNAAPPLSNRAKPASQTRNFTAQLRGPLIPGKMTMTLSLQNNERESEGSAIRAVGPNGPVNQGITSLNKTRSVTFGPSLSITKANTLTGSFNFSDNRGANSGVGGLNLPERASNRNGHNWSVQLTDRHVFSSRLTNELRFQARQSNSSNMPITDAIAINVLDAFNGGGAPNRSSDRSRDYTAASQIRWQATRTLNITSSLQLDYHQTHSDSRNNYNGTFTFSSLQDYCFATGFLGTNCQDTRAIVEAAQQAGTIPTFTNSSGTEIEITGIPSRFEQTFGNPILDVHQGELTAFLQGEWRTTPRLNVSFGARYQMQQHLHDYNNIAPTAGVAYQLFTKPNWRTVIRGGARMTYSTFSLGSWEQLVRNDGDSEQFTTVILSPSYPNPLQGSGTTSVNAIANSIRVRTDDYVAPYSIQPSFSWEQTLPKRMSVNVNFQINRGVHQSRTRNINAPYPGTALPEDLVLALNSRDLNTRNQAKAVVDQLRPFYPFVGNITQVESTGLSTSKNLSIQFRTQNVPVLWNKVQISGNVTWAMAWAEDNNGTPMNSYDIASEWGRSSQDQRHRLSSNLNIRLPRNMQFTINPGWTSGRPYNITLGRDVNGDSSNNDRPAGLAKNSGTGPSNFTNLNLNFTKTFVLASRPATPPAGNEWVEPQRGGGGFGGGGGAGGGGGFGGQGGGGRVGGQGPRSTDRQIQLTVRVSNLFNSTTRTGISGVMSSPLFGQLIGGGQGRQITVGLNTNLGKLF